MANNPYISDTFRSGKVIIRDSGRPTLPATEEGGFTPGPPGPNGFGAFYDDFVATLGQTVFTLSQAPADPNLVLAVVDHISFLPGDAFSVVGTTFTWFGSPFVFDLMAGQDVRIYYT